MGAGAAAVVLHSLFEEQITRESENLDRYLDFWCFHFYDQASALNSLVVFYKGKTTKPVMLQEYGLATGGPGAALRAAV